MKPLPTVVLLVATSMALTPLALAQTTPQPDTTSPSAASSPHQRDATGTRAPEAPTTNGANPSAASSPHQAHLAGGGQTGPSGPADAKQTMKACVVREQADHTGMSAADAKKACKAQLKGTAPK